MEPLSFDLRVLASVKGMQVGAGRGPEETGQEGPQDKEMAQQVAGESSGHRLSCLFA